jgi:hypothetical protein
MNWFDNVSSDCDQPIAAAFLMEGHWRHRLHAYAEPVLCRVVIDVAEPRVVAAQVIEHGTTQDLGSGELEDLNQALAAQDVLQHPSAWGFTPRSMLPGWARPSFSESQIDELERIEGYLIEATDDTIESVLKLRDEFLRGTGLNDQAMARAVRQPEHGQTARKPNRLVN